MRISAGRLVPAGLFFCLLLVLVIRPGRNADLDFVAATRSNQLNFVSTTVNGTVHWPALEALNVIHRPDALCWESEDDTWDNQTDTHRPRFVAVIIAGLLRSLGDPVVFSNLHANLVTAMQANVVVFLSLSDRCDAQGYSHDLYPCSYRRADIGPMLKVLRPAHVSWDEDEPKLKKCPPMDKMFFASTIRMQMKRRHAYHVAQAFEKAHGFEFEQFIITTTNHIFLRFVVFPPCPRLISQLFETPSLLRPLTQFCKIRLVNPGYRREVLLSDGHWDWINVTPRMHVEGYFSLLDDYVNCTAPFRLDYIFMDDDKKWGVLPEPWLKYYLDTHNRFHISTSIVNFWDLPVRPYSAKLMNGRHGMGGHGNRWWVNYCGNWWQCGNKDILISRDMCMFTFYRKYDDADLDSLPCSHRNMSYTDCCDGWLKTKPWDKDNNALIYKDPGEVI